MRVILADDSVLLREGLARMLSESGFEVVAQVGDAEALLAAVDADPPDVCIVDIRMPPTNTTEGLQAALHLRVHHPEVAVLVLSQYVETRYAMELLAQGADGVGYLLKDRVGDIAELLAALRSVVAGRSVIDPTVVSRLVGRRRQADPMETLTAREREVLEQMAEGRSNRAIGERLFLSPKTVEAHVSAIFSKLGIEDTADDNRRVLSVLTWLRGDGGEAQA
jgi:DNA-binding NarL/FixJ family response regulator